VYASSEFNSANCLETAQITCFNCGGEKNFTVEKGQTCENLKQGEQSYTTIKPSDCGQICTQEVGSCFDSTGKNVTYTTGCEKASLCVEPSESFSEKYGLYLGFGVIGLVVLYFFLDDRNKKGRKKR
jgi:hypothetical protein